MAEVSKTWSYSVPLPRPDVASQVGCCILGSGVGDPRMDVYRSEFPKYFDDYAAEIEAAKGYIDDLTVDAGAAALPNRTL